MDAITEFVYWINHYQTKFKEINEILEESKTELKKTADMFDSSFKSRTISTGGDKVKSAADEIEKANIDVADTLAYLDKLLNEVV